MGVHDHQGRPAPDHRGRVSGELVGAAAEHQLDLPATTLGIGGQPLVAEAEHHPAAAASAVSRRMSRSRSARLLWNRCRRARRRRGDPATRRPGELQALERDVVLLHAGRQVGDAQDVKHTEDLKLALAPGLDQGEQQLRVRRPACMRCPGGFSTHRTRPRPVLAHSADEGMPHGAHVAGCPRVQPVELAHAQASTRLRAKPRTGSDPAPAGLGFAGLPVVTPACRVTWRSAATGPPSSGSAAGPSWGGVVRWAMTASDPRGQRSAGTVTWIARCAGEQAEVHQGRLVAERPAGPHRGGSGPDVPLPHPPGRARTPGCWRMRSPSASQRVTLLELVASVMSSRRAAPWGSSVESACMPALGRSAARPACSLWTTRRRTAAAQERARRGLRRSTAAQVDARAGRRPAR